jgi:hypothetical protein
VDVVVAVGADEESAAVMEPGEGAFDDPAVMAETGAVGGLAASDDRLDTALPDEAAVLVVVVAAKPNFRHAQGGVTLAHNLQRMALLT